nr:autotransporter outer membrane beta-barrel domain-containing protein [Serratia marcescens]
MAGNVSFEPGSRYAVEVGPNGQSDRIQSSGSATIGGGEVAVTLENSANLLTQSEVRSLLGQQYTILSAQQGVSGRVRATQWKWGRTARAIGSRAAARRRSAAARWR